MGGPCVTEGRYAMVLSNDWLGAYWARLAICGETDDEVERQYRTFCDCKRFQVDNCCTGPARMAKTGGRVCCISQIIMLRLMDVEGDLLRKIYVGMQDVEVQTGTQLLPNWYSVW